MATDSSDSVQPKNPLDFWKFWIGQIISSLGSSFTTFALPLLVFKLTGSAINVGLTAAASFIPYLLFGLIIGAWVDRVDRRRLMIITDLLRAVIIAALPTLAFSGHLTVWWIYATLFLNSTLSISFDAASFAAVPNLVEKKDMVTVNGRILAGYAFASALGPSLAALLLVFVTLPAVLFCDALSFLISAVSLSLIHTSFNAPNVRKKDIKSIPRDIGEGLSYVVHQPVMRWLSIMLVLVNLVVPTVVVQFVLLAKRAVGVSDSQLGLLYAAGSFGVVIISLSAGRLRKLGSFSSIALGALMLQGLMVIVLSFVHSYWIVLPLWAIISGMSSLFNINLGSLWQTTIPNHMLGRIISFVRVLAWSTSPLGPFIGGVLIEHTHNVSLVYTWLGIFAFIIPCTFIFTPVGRSKAYLPQEEALQVQK